MTEVPRLFRVALQVAGRDDAAAFYERLLGIRGQPIGDSRSYFSCGHVVLMLVDTTGEGGRPPTPHPDITYFEVDDIAAAHERCRGLGCLLRENVHGESGGEIVVRPWGERSFYVSDPYGNELCFVEAPSENRS